MEKPSADQQPRVSGRSRLAWYVGALVTLTLVGFGIGSYLADQECAHSDGDCDLGALAVIFVGGAAFTACLVTIIVVEGIYRLGRLRRRSRTRD